MMMMVMPCGEVVRSVSRVLEALRRANIQHAVDDCARSIETCTPLQDGLTVLTSPSAIRSYDAYHPERIVCIVLKPDYTFRVVVNNRQSIDVDAELRSFWTMDRQQALHAASVSCGICYQSAQTQTPRKKKKRSRQFRFAVCTHCAFVSCVACLQKMGSLGAPAVRCPNCRRWGLDGDAFGTPLAMLQSCHRDCDDNEATKRCGGENDGINVFVERVIAPLDGEVTILPRIGEHVVADANLVTCRLAGTKRLSKEDPAYMTTTQLRKKLQQLWTACSRFRRCQFYVYVFRTTFCTDVAETQKLIEEVSFFQITPDRRLLQIDDDAWVLPAVSMAPEGADTKQVKVMHAEPHRYEAPAAFEKLLRHINEVFPHFKAVSLSVRSSCTGAGKSTANFDVSADGQVLTMSKALLARMTYTVLESAGESDGVVVVCVRVFCHGERVRDRADLVSFRLQPTREDEPKRMPADESRRLFDTGVDGPGFHHVRIVNFL